MSRKLTAKQEQFVAEYLVDLNGAAAARRAGYSIPNADRIATQLLGKSHVKEAIDAAKAERAGRTQVTADMVLRGLLKEAQREEEGSSHGARVSAWTQLGKHLAMFVDKLAPVNPDGQTPYDGGIAGVGSLLAELREAVDRRRRQSRGTNGQHLGGPPIGPDMGAPAGATNGRAH